MHSQFSTLLMSPTPDYAIEVGVVVHAREEERRAQCECSSHRALGCLTSVRVAMRNRTHNGQERVLTRILGRSRRPTIVPPSPLPLRACSSELCPPKRSRRESKSKVLIPEKLYLWERDCTTNGGGGGRVVQRRVHSGGKEQSSLARQCTALCKEIKVQQVSLFCTRAFLTYFFVIVNNWCGTSPHHHN